ncbi:MAG: RecX family transcriptional regulator [Clostridia bacterium]|nr:RecX family transcriptional regulator [Clostridia bacterium]
MKITDITQQVKHPNRVSVFIDGKFAFGMEKEDCLFMGLKPDTELTKERYDYIVDNAIYTRAYKKADRYIGFKMRTEKEVRRKLKEEEYSDDIIERVIASMLKYKYINDEAYALMYAKDCVKLKKWGPQRIKAELLKKGVSSSFIDSALEQLDLSNTDEIIDTLLQKRIKETPIDLKEKQKHFNYLLRRGFKYDDIKQALDKYCK